MFHILVVDDDKNTRRLLRAVLEAEHYTVTTACDGEEALAVLDREHIDLAILDIMMPHMDGYEFTSLLRAEQNDLPILMVTAKQLPEDKKKGFLVGTDDYMTKPFVPEELLARIRALSRRQGEVLLEEISMEDLTLSLSTNDLLCGAKSIHLAFKEFEIMKILLSNQKTIVSKEMLISKVWGDDSDAEDNNVEAYISFLRKKLSFLGSCVQISTIRKVGYRLESGNG